MSSFRAGNEHEEHSVLCCFRVGNEHKEHLSFVLLKTEVLLMLVRNPKATQNGDAPHARLQP